MIGWKAISARRSRSCTRLILSSEDAEIQREGLRHGAEVPFTRPAELATDTAPSSEVIAHAMEWIEQNTLDRYDAVMLLEPSSPFTRPADYDAAVALMLERDALMVVGMRHMEVSSVFVGIETEDGHLTEIIDKMQHMRSVIRQATRREWTMNGGLFLFRWDYFKAHRNIYHDRERSFGYLMPSEYSLEIDEWRDLHLAEFLVEKGVVDMSLWR